MLPYPCAAVYRFSTSIKYCDSARRRRLLDGINLRSAGWKGVRVAGRGEGGEIEEERREGEEEEIEEEKTVVAFWSFSIESWMILGNRNF